MRKIKIALAIIPLLLAFPLTSPASDNKYQAISEEPTPSLSDEIEQKTKAAIAKLIQMLSKIVEHLPQYEMPEVLENGDIIIRRKHEEEQAEPAESNRPI